jgi:hypothetical protein
MCLVRRWQSTDVALGFISTEHLLQSALDRDLVAQQPVLNMQLAHGPE